MYKKVEDMAPEPLCFVRTFPGAPYDLVEVTLDFAADAFVTCIARHEPTGQVLAGTHTKAALLQLNPGLADVIQLVATFASLPRMITMPQGLVVHYDGGFGPVLIFVSTLIGRTETLLLAP